jgi:hypothetical protein
MDGTNARPLEFVDLCSPRAVRAGRGSSDGDRMRLRDPHRRSDPLMNLCVRPDTSRSHHRGTPREVDSGHALDRRDRDIVAHDDAVPPPGYCSDALDSRPGSENQRGRHRDDHQQDHTESAQRNPHRLEGPVAAHRLVTHETIMSRWAMEHIGQKEHLHRARPASASAVSSGDAGRSRPCSPSSLCPRAARQLLGPTHRGRRRSARVPMSTRAAGPATSGVPRP